MAASVALSLLDDAVAVYELCGIVPKFPDEELTHHKGLLDGINLSVTIHLMGI